MLILISPLFKIIKKKLPVLNFSFLANCLFLIQLKQKGKKKYIFNLYIFLFFMITKIFIDIWCAKLLFVAKGFGWHK